jgi:hypothetical protein
MTRIMIFSDRYQPFGEHVKVFLLLKMQNIFL